MVRRFIELDGTQESEALFQVIATFLKFDEAEVLRLQVARRRRGWKPRGSLLGMLASPRYS